MIRWLKDNFWEVIVLAFILIGGITAIWFLNHLETNNA